MELENIQFSYSKMFTEMYGDYDSEYIINIDETCIPFDVYDNHSYAFTGTSPKVKGSSNKQSNRMTAVAAGTKSGKKLDTLFIVKGTPGGRIVSNLNSLNLKATFVAQNSAWVTSSTFKNYLQEVIFPYCKGNLFVLVLDNLSCHTREEIKSLVKCNGGSISYLPPYSTSICQPLDVGVFGPLKQIMSRLNMEDRCHYKALSEK